MAGKKTTSAPPDRTALLVLGMHRSGTSALAGVLAELGCDRPSTEMKPTSDNERGYFESNRVYQLHTRLLESAGTAWDDWDQFNPDWIESPRGPEFHQKALEALSEEFGNSSLFVLKDPRICRLVPFWNGVLNEAGYRPLVVHTHRNPLQVASSLERRDGYLPEISVLIWLRHVLDAEHDTRGLQRVFTSYDELLTDWRAVISTVQDKLKFKLPRASDAIGRKVDQFLSPELRHFDQPKDQLINNKSIPSWVRDAYRILERWAETGEDAEGCKQFDRIRSEFNAITPAFSGVINAGHAANSNMLEQRDAREKDAERISALEAQIEELNAKLHETKSALEQRRHEADDIRSSLKEAETDLAEKNGRITAMSEQLSKAETDIKSRFMELAHLTNALVRKDIDLERQEKQIHDLQSGLLDREKCLELKERELELLRCSTSWRLMAPVRGLGRIMGRR